MRCPYCGSENVTYPTVDIGVGEAQCGAAGCEDCHAVEMSADDAEATQEERKLGWYRGEK